MSPSLSRRTALAAAAAFAIAHPHRARAAPRILRMGHNNTETSHYNAGCKAFAAAVAQAPELAGFTIEVHPNAELGDELGMLKNCSKGLLDLALIAGSVTSNLVPEIGLINAPFLFSAVSHARLALDGPIGADLIATAAKKDVNILAWGENGLRHVTANTPIRNPTELKGLKLRVPQSEIMLGAFRALGAEANSLSFNLLREALRTGQFQAQENPIVAIEAAKLNELQSHLSLTGHVYDPAPIIASPDLLEDLTPPQLAALRKCAAVGAAASREAAANAQRDGVGRLQAAGMKVITDIDLAAFTTAIKPFFTSLAATYGQERIDRLTRAGQGEA